MRRDVRDPILASIASALLLVPVVVFAYAVGSGVRLDSSLLSHLVVHDRGAGHSLAAAVVALGEPLPLLALLAVVVAIGVAAGRSRQALVAVAVVAGANLTTQVLKHVLSHPRLHEELANYANPWPDSFPSGHTTAAASIGVALLLVLPARLRPPATIAAAAFTVAMGIAVVVLGWHYPSDVLGALLVVGSWGFAAVAALRLLRPPGPASPPRRRSETSTGRFAVSLQ